MRTAGHSAEGTPAVGRIVGILVLLAGILLAAHLCAATPAGENSVPSIFKPQSTPAESIYHLSRFVLAITGAIFVVVFSLLTFVVVRFRKRRSDNGREPAQVYGSTQIKLAWTVIPILIVVVLFSERVVYPMFLTAPRRFGLTVLEDQQSAAALMWTCVTIVYLVPATILTMRLLGARNSPAKESMQPNVPRVAVLPNHPQKVEAV